MLVNLSGHDNVEKARNLMEDYGYEAIAFYDVDDVLTSAYNIVGIPAAYYIKPDGTIKNISFGADIASGILEKIEK
jgi:hypothetical protein